MFGTYFKIFEEDLYSPRIDVLGKVTVVNAPSGPINRYVNRVFVKNRGLRAAEGCKAELVIDDIFWRLREGLFLQKGQLQLSMLGV